MRATPKSISHTFTAFISANNTQCTSLSAAPRSQVHYGPLSDLVFFPASYFTAQQREVMPACIVQLQSIEDVAFAVRIIAEINSGDDDDMCISAVKSGGHGTFAGASNAPGGITIDLQYLDDVVVAEDRETVAFGPGNRGGVYDVLEPFGITVAGGRDDSVGVGGFLEASVS